MSVNRPMKAAPARSGARSARKARLQFEPPQESVLGRQYARRLRHWADGGCQLGWQGRDAAQRCDGPSLPASARYMRLAGRPCSLGHDADALVTGETARTTQPPVCCRKARILAVAVPVNLQRVMQAVGRRRQNWMLSVACRLICRGAVRQGGRWHQHQRQPGRLPQSAVQ